MYEPVLETWHNENETENSPTTTFYSIHRREEELEKEGDLNKKIEFIIQEYIFLLATKTEISEQNETGDILAIPSGQPEKSIELVEKVHTLFKNQDNWDDYGTPKISEKLREKFYEILDLICMNRLELPCVFPVCGGGLQFEWDCGNKSLELEFNEESISFLKIEKKPHKETIYIEKDDVPKNEIPELIRWVECS